ncbi:hypothetical protein MTO96_049690 [Rhipicephalus appendiculatus]
MIEDVPSREGEEVNKKRSVEWQSANSGGDEDARSTIGTAGRRRAHKSRGGPRLRATSNAEKKRKPCAEYLHGPVPGHHPIPLGRNARRDLFPEHAAVDRLLSPPRNGPAARGDTRQVPQRVSRAHAAAVTSSVWPFETRGDGGKKNCAATAWTKTCLALMGTRKGPGRVSVAQSAGQWRRDGGKERDAAFLLPGPISLQGRFGTKRTV